MTAKKWHGDEMVRKSENLIAHLGNAMDSLATMRSGRIRQPVDFLKAGLSIYHDLAQASKIAYEMMEVIKANNRVRE